MSDIYGWKKDSPVNATSQVLRTLVSHQTFPSFRVFPHLIILLCSRIFTYKRKNLGDVGLLHITRTEVSPLNDNMTFFFLFGNHCYINLSPQIHWLALCRLAHSFVGEGNGTPIQYSCLENPMDGGAW